jgi:hypothetical protein
MSLDIVSGALSTMAELEKDEAWLQGWLKEKPVRLGLGALEVADAEPVHDDAGNPAFLAADDGRYFSVNVRLGELEAAHGFGVLDSWARNRVRHPDKEHVAVLVTESTGDRYRPTLLALAEHLPLVVVELQVWRGEREALIVPHVAMASDDVDLAATPAAKAAAAAEAVAVSAAASVKTTGAGADSKAGSGGSAVADHEPEIKVPDGKDSEIKLTGTTDPADDGTPANKDDTGVEDPWGLPKKEPEAATSGSGSNGGRLLTKFNT